MKRQLGFSTKQTRPENSNQKNKLDMQKQYNKISEKTESPHQGVHLVHYVLKNMKSACVFPPNPSKSQEFYSPENICSAIIAYLHRHHPEDPWGTLKQFGFESSAQIGLVAKAIQGNGKTRVVSDLKIKVADFEGIYSAGTSSQHTAVRWLLEMESNQFEAVTETRKILSRHFNGVRLDELVVNKRRFPEHVRADLQLALDHYFDGRDDVQLHGLSQKHSHEGLSFRALTDSDKHYRVKVGPLSFSDIDVGSEQPVRCLANGLWLATEDKEIPFAVVLGSGPRHVAENVQIEYVTRDSDAAQALADSFFDSLQEQIENSKCYRGKILSFEQSEDYYGRSTGLKVHQLKRVKRAEVILPQKTLDLLDRNVIDFVRHRPELKKRGMNVKKGLLFFGPPGTGKTHTVHYLSRALPDLSLIHI